MKKFLERLKELKVKYFLSMTGEESGLVYKFDGKSLDTKELWFEFSCPDDGLKILESV